MDVGNADSDTKAHVKKSVDAAKKAMAKEAKAKAKSVSKNKALNVRRFALTNSQQNNSIRTYKDMLSNPLVLEKKTSMADANATLASSLGISSQKQKQSLSNKKSCHCSPSCCMPIY